MGGAIYIMGRDQRLVEDGNYWADVCEYVCSVTLD